MKTPEHQNIKTNEYKDDLKRKMNTYVHFVYKITKKFPQDELYGVTSQFRRATLSIILNYIEGYARRRPASQLNFLEIAYGSFKESKYLLYFSKEELYILEDEHTIGMQLAEEIGAMLWTEIVSLEKSMRD